MIGQSASALPVGYAVRRGHREVAWDEPPRLRAVHPRATADREGVVAPATVRRQNPSRYAVDHSDPWPSVRIGVGHGRQPSHRPWVPKMVMRQRRRGRVAPGLHHQHRPPGLGQHLRRRSPARTRTDHDTVIAIRQRRPRRDRQVRLNRREVGPSARPTIAHARRLRVVPLQHQPHEPRTVAVREHRLEVRFWPGHLQRPLHPLTPVRPIEGQHPLDERHRTGLRRRREVIRRYGDLRQPFKYQPLLLRQSHGPTQSDVALPVLGDRSTPATPRPAEFVLAGPFWPSNAVRMAFDHYYLLGRSGLRVSRLALGTMNFGTGGFHAAYGKTEDEARADLPARTSMPAATSSTRPTSTPRARARRSSAR